jgi:hypothetical protein
MGIDEQTNKKQNKQTNKTITTKKPTPGSGTIEF